MSYLTPDVLASAVFLLAVILEGISLGRRFSKDARQRSSEPVLRTGPDLQ